MTVDSVLADITAFFTDGGNALNLITIFIICVACFILAGLLRLVFGQKATTVKAVNVTLDILIFYCICFVLLQCAPALEGYLPRLPFATLGHGYISFLPIIETEKALISIELVDLIVLAFLFGLTEDLIPEGRNLLLWLLLRTVCMLAVYVTFQLIHWIFTAILPGFILVYAPVILLILLAVFLAVTVFKWLISVILGVTGGPVLGAIYAFFISNIVGRQLTKAAISSGLIILLLYLANCYDLCTLNLEIFSFSTAILTTAAPIAVRYLVSKLF